MPLNTRCFGHALPERLAAAVRHLDALEVHDLVPSAVDDDVYVEGLASHRGHAALVNRLGRGRDERHVVALERGVEPDGHERSLAAKARPRRHQLSQRRVLHRFLDVLAPHRIDTLLGLVIEREGAGREMHDQPMQTAVKAPEWLPLPQTST
jgi:hypothetical protein